MEKLSLKEVVVQLRGVLGYPESASQPDPQKRLEDRYLGLISGIDQLNSMVELTHNGTFQQRIAEHEKELEELLKDHPELKTIQFKIYPED